MEQLCSGDIIMQSKQVRIMCFRRIPMGRHLRKSLEHSGITERPAACCWDTGRAARMGLSEYLTRILRLVLLFTFGVWIKDANTPYRLMKASQLQKVLERIPEGFDLSNVLMTVIYEKHHLGVQYYPITFRPRQGGKNSINMKRIAGIGKQAWKDFRKMKRSI